MKLLSIISLTFVLVVVYGSRFEVQGGEVTESNVTDRFVDALAEDKVSEFMGDLLSHRQYGLLRIIGKDEFITMYFPIDEQFMKFLVDANDFELIRKVFKSQYHKRSEIIQHMISLRGLAYTLETIGKDAYPWIPINERLMKALADTNDPELIREVFKLQYHKRSEIIKHMISLRGLAYTLETIGKDKCKEHFPVDEKSMRALVDANDLKLIRKVFKSQRFERGEIIWRMILLRGLAYTLETIGKDAYSWIRIGEKTMKALVDADNPELIRKFFKSRGSGKRKIIKHMILLRGLAYTLETIGKDAYPWVRIDEQFMKALVDTNDLELIRGIFKSQDFEQSEIIRYMILLRGLAYTLETIGKDKCKEHFPVDEKSMRALVDANDLKLIRGIFKSQDFEQSEIIRYMISLKGLAYTIMTIRRNECVLYFPTDKQSIKALVDADDFELVKEVFESQRFERGEIIWHMILLRGLAYTLEAIGKDEYKTYFPTDEQSTKALADTDDPELIRAVFESQDSERSEIIRRVVLLIGLAYTLETFEKDECKMYFPIYSILSMEALIDADDPVLIRAFESQRFERSEIIQRMISLKGLAYTLETPGKNEYPWIPINERLMKALIDANDPELIREIFESQDSERSEIIRHMLLLRGLAYTLEAFGKDAWKMYFPVYSILSMWALVDTDDTGLIMEVFESQIKKSQQIIESLKELRGLTYTLKTLREGVLGHVRIDEEFVMALAGAKDKELVAEILEALNRDPESREAFSKALSSLGADNDEYLSDCLRAWM